MVHSKRLVLAVLCCLMILAAALPARAEGELQLASQTAVLMDADTGVVLYEKNMHDTMYPASITTSRHGAIPAMPRLEEVR